MPVAATIWEWSLPPISGKILFYGWVIISFAMLDLVADPLWCRKPQGGNQQRAFAKLFFEVPVSVRSSAMFFVIADLCKAEFPFMTKSLKCNARVLLPAFQYLLITLSSASSTFSIWGCAGPRGGVVWPNQWNLIISHIFPINDHSTGAIPLFHLETAWRRVGRAYVPIQPGMVYWHLPAGHQNCRETWAQSATASDGHLPRNVHWIGCWMLDAGRLKFIKILLFLSGRLNFQKTR